MQAHRFMVAFVCALTALSLVSVLSAGAWDPLRRANLLSEILVGQTRSDSAGKGEMRDSALANTGEEAAKDSTRSAVVNASPEAFLRYRKPNVITDFRVDSTRPALSAFIQKLQAMRTGGRKRVRIAYIGDSMIEGDLISGTLRRLLQARFGGHGAGFVHVKIVSAGARATATVSLSGEWSDLNLSNDRDESNFFLSGHLNRSTGAGISVTDRSVEDPRARLSIDLFCGPSRAPVVIGVDERQRTIHPQSDFNVIPLAKGDMRTVRLSFPPAEMPVYGVSFASDSGVIVDNLPHRGLTGMELSRIPGRMLGDIATKGGYDLVVLQFGLNLVAGSGKVQYNSYRRSMVRTLDSMKAAMPDTEFLLIGCSDMARLTPEGYRTPATIEKLVETQASIAMQTGTGFFNLFETMGGENAIVRWVNAKPPMAVKDHRHPNRRGGEWIGKALYDAILREMAKAEKGQEGSKAAKQAP